MENCSVVVASRDLPFDADQWRRLDEAISEGLLLVEPSDEAALTHALKSAHIAILADTIDLSGLETPNLRWVHINHAGLEAMAKPAYFERGIAVTGSAGRSAPALAEHALMFCLMLSSRYSAFAEAQRQQQWLSQQPESARALKGQTLGIIGLGNSGGELAIRAAALGMTVLGYRRRNAPPPEGVSRVYSRDNGDSLDTILSASDIVILTVTLSDSTYHLIGRGEIARMKRGSMLVNLARGEVVDQDALMDALRTGHLAGAGLDVTTPEPLPSSHPLWRMPNVLITPHTTAPISDKSERSLQIILENLRRYRANLSLHNMLAAEDIYSAR
jgi:phosphoglycerate dehydrogenase-like enzyme